jgi:hypothetical protein
MVTGAIREIATGDTLTGMARTLPFYLADTSPSPIPLTATLTGADLPFTLASGSASNIPTSP